MNNNLTWHYFMVVSNSILVIFLFKYSFYCYIVVRKKYSRYCNILSSYSWYDFRQKKNDLCICNRPPTILKDTIKQKDVFSPCKTSMLNCFRLLALLFFDDMNSAPLPHTDTNQRHRLITETSALFWLMESDRLPATPTY